MTTAVSTMQAAVIDRFGGPEELRIAKIPAPAAGPDDVLIRVEAAGVGSWDAEEREGGYDGLFGVPSTFPYVLGWDGAGTVAVVGGNVRRFVVGDRVYAASTPLPRGGFYAQYAVVDQGHVARIPDGLSVEHAAAMPWDALTALSGLDALALRAGQSVMVFGASGGIGHFAVQLAAHRGLKVFAVASGADGVAFARRLGADAAVDGRSFDAAAAARRAAPSGLDGALFTAGGTVADRALAAVKDGGTAAVPNGVEPEPGPRPGVRVVRYDGARDRFATDRLNRLVEAGAFTVHVDRTFRFDDVAEAHRALTTHHLGKYVLRVR